MGDENLWKKPLEEAQIGVRIFSSILTYSLWGPSVELHEQCALYLSQKFEEDSEAFRNVKFILTKPKPNFRLPPIFFKVSSFVEESEKKYGAAPKAIVD